MGRIEWTDAVWNPVTGCTKVSQGCKHCYAETFARRQMGPWKGRAFTDVRCHEDRLDVPLHWRKPRRVFVNSMSDLFHPDVPDAFVDRVFAVVALCPRHTFQILTKRPERMRDYLAEPRRRQRVKGIAWEMLGHPPLHKYHHRDRDGLNVIDRPWPLPNVWLGVSVEDQATANERIPQLLQTPAALRFVSCEPLLGPIDLTRVDTTSDTDPGYSALELHDDDEGDLVETLDWVIAGGESGPKARPCHVDWIRSAVEQCRAAAVPVFVKQMGGYPRVAAARLQHWEWRGIARPKDKRFTQDGEIWRVHLKDRKGGDPAEWPENLRVREWPEDGK